MSCSYLFASPNGSFYKENEQGQKITKFWKQCATYQLMNQTKILFFLSTEKWGVLPSCFVLCSFLIPLSIALGASAKTDLTSEIDHFNAFPYDPFPSSTVCFTNWSMLEQENRWENLTEPFSQRLEKVKRMRLKN